MKIKYSDLKAQLLDKGFQQVNVTRVINTTYSFFEFTTIKTKTKITYIIEFDYYSDNVIDTFKATEFTDAKDYLESVDYDISRK
ncbi:MAG: hypothetical protein ACP5N7_03880 [Candidatus Pacearchaeota archaeon]